MSNLIDGIKRHWSLILFVILFLIILVLGSIIVVRESSAKKQAERNAEIEHNAVYRVVGIKIYEDVSGNPLEPEEEKLGDVSAYGDLQIDFDYLKQINPDVYAWITVPGTDVSYPILQSEIDNYYLRKNIDRTYGTAGCLYTNKTDAKDFSSFVTTIYGHNMKNGTMFGSLKNYYDEDFFLEHDEIVIYTPEERLTYEIMKTRRHDDAYLYKQYDGFSEAGKEDFLFMMNLGEGSIGHVKDTDFKYSKDDKFVVLSTCIKNNDEKRYLIIGRLVKREQYIGQ